MAVEIRSPDDRPKEIAAKIAHYLRLGVQVVWDIDPKERAVTIYQGDAEPQACGDDMLLTEPALLPGFEMSVMDLFAW